MKCERGVKKRREIRRLFSFTFYQIFTSPSTTVHIILRPDVIVTVLYSVRYSKEGDKWRQESRRGGWNMRLEGVVIAENRVMWGGSEIVMTCELFLCLSLLILLCWAFYIVIAPKDGLLIRGSALSLGEVFRILWCLYLRLERHIGVRSGFYT